MYTNEKYAAEWRKSQDEKRADVSQDNPRDIVDAIDELIKVRLVQTQPTLWVDGEKAIAQLNEKAELLKRKITDYLLVTDPRAGVFRKP